MTHINLVTLRRRSNSPRIPQQECHPLSNLVHLLRLAVLTPMLLTVATKTTSRCGMLPWLRNKGVSRLKVSSDKKSNITAGRESGLLKLHRG